MKKQDLYVNSKMIVQKSVWYLFQCHDDRNIFIAYESNRSSFNFQKLSFYVLADVVEKPVSVKIYLLHNCIRF